jgi:hypothetical protein
MSKQARNRKQLTDAHLNELSKEFDQPDYMPRFGRAPLGEQRRHDRALLKARRKRGRPTIGEGAERIQITVERTLLAEADHFARGKRISRSELIARGLRMALAVA